MDEQMQNLRLLMPKFEDDSDEPWMRHLKPKQLSKIKNKRSKILQVMEQLDSCRKQYKRSNCKDTDMASKIKAYEDDLTTSLRTFIEKCTPLKAEAEAEAKRKEEQEVQARKRARLDLVNANDIDEYGEELDLRADDYLPRDPTKIKRGVGKEKPSASARALKRPSAGPTPQSSAKKQQRQLDKFLEGVDPEDVEFLKKNRRIIEGISCKQRVLNVIAGLKSQQRLRNAIEETYKALEQMKGKK